MFWYRRDPGADGVGVAVTSAALNFADPPDPTTFAGLADALGVRIAVVLQVHGAAVAEITQTWTSPGPLLDLTDQAADALVTTETGVGLAVRVADCIPILFADPGRRVIAATHAGRVGLEKGVVGATIRAMRERGARDIVGWVGPHLCGECYELPPELARETSARLGVPVATTSWGTPALDLAAALRVQLEVEGVRAEQIEACTRTTPSLHSWRRDGAASGRQVGVVWLG